MTARPARVARHSRHTLGVLLHRIHRWMGVAVSLFVIFLVVTGWALNHTAELGLARLSVQVPWISAWYGLRGAVPARGYRASGHWLIGGENGALFDGKPTAFKLHAPIGMVATGEFVAIASREGLTLVNSHGRLIDQMTAAQLPAGSITAIGAAENQIVLRGAANYASLDGVNWTPFTGEVSWSVAQALPPSQQTLANQLAPALPLERIMQDLHSGRILGQYGPYLMDAVGVLLLSLAASGLWMFFRRKYR